MSPVEASNSIDTEDLHDVSDQVNQSLYIHTDPKTGKKEAYVRVYLDDVFDIGIQLGGPLSDKILDGLGVIRKIQNDSANSDV